MTAKIRVTTTITLAEGSTTPTKRHRTVTCKRTVYMYL
jgi:hypothetical protein